MSWPRLRFLRMMSSKGGIVGVGFPPAGAGIELPVSTEPFLAGANVAVGVEPLPMGTGVVPLTVGVVCLTADGALQTTQSINIQSPMQF